MHFSHLFRRWHGWPREILLAGVALAVGFLLMPVLVYYAGSSLLGRYEGASVAHMFQSVYGGLKTGSESSWIVLLGPYGLYLLCRALKAWWRLSAKLA